MDWIAGKVQIGLATVLLVYGAALKANSADYDNFPIIKSTLGWFQSTAWLALLVGPTAVGILQWIRKRFGDPWAFKSIQPIMNEFRNEVFSGLSGPLDHHRVTLFKHCKGWWGRGKLKAVVRSDHLTKMNIRKFSAPDDGDLCEGVVGLAYRSREWVMVPEPGKTLPALSKFSTDLDIQQYARATHDDPAFIRKYLRNGKLPANCYAGLAVQVAGEPWGVILIDSRKPGSIDGQKLDKFKVYGKLMQPLLERM
ncbi:MAG: hypothetical protein JSS51_12610 [Planctomycetes bacterium]|nr:hypothetical protein [Planctomycetota bacterium]